MDNLENDLKEIKKSIDKQTRLLNDIFHDNKNSQSEGYVVLDDNNNNIRQVCSVPRNLWF